MSGRAGTSGAAGAGAGGSDEDSGTPLPNDAGSAAAGAAMSGTSGAGAAAPRSTGPGDWSAGDYPPELAMPNFLEITGLPNQAGMARQYKVHVPPSYDPNVPTPVVFCFHGLGQDALLFCLNGAGMPEKSDKEGFILVMPNGFANSWNGGTCCGDAAAQKLDEIGFVRALFAEVGKHLNIDLTRVYATGLSNGGYMSFRVACEASDIFTAVAPGAGAIGSADIGGGTQAESDITACMAKGVSVLAIHGTEDGLVAYSVHKPSLDRIAEQNGCMLTTKPATQPVSMGDTTCTSYEGCPAGVDVTGCSVQGGGHVWFGSPNCGTGVDAACAIVGANSTSITNTDVIWEFFRKHARP
ncbi:MAG TPA: PHB depolymerase family esterase [Polyangiales bacterium]|nr:PHB depolymerase family esterase [Polyangiales bacterium]